MRLIELVKTIRETVITGKISPAKILPAPLLLCVSLRRPGISPMDITSEWIVELDKLNIPIGKNTDGSPNLILGAGYALVKVFTKAIKQNGLVTVAGSPGSITFTGTGGNAGGPVVIKGANDAPFTIKGIFQ